VLCAVGALFLGTLAALTLSSEGLSIAVVACSIFSVVCGLATVDALTSRVELSDETLVVVTNLRKRVYPKSAFRAVAWAESAPPSLQFWGGEWLQLPRIMPNGMGPANSIKAWLKVQ
jgi:hypothetical protein